MDKKGGNPKKLRLGGNGLGSVKNGFAWLWGDRKFRSGRFGGVFGHKTPEKNKNKKHPDLFGTPEALIIVGGVTDLSIGGIFTYTIIGEILGKPKENQ